VVWAPALGRQLDGKALQSSLTLFFNVATLNHANRVRLGKRRGQRVKHGVSLAIACELDWDAALVWVDERFKYGELRLIALAPNTGILYYVAFVERGEIQKIISLRRATRREVKHYVENI
jgi:uncharacterized DUF497 family protein